MSISDPIARRELAANGQLEAEVRAVAQELFASAAPRRPALYRGINGALLARCMADPRLSGALFRFVDTLPQLQRSRHPEQAIASHLAAYLDAAGASGALARLLRFGARPRLAWLARRQVHALSRQLLAGEADEAFETLLDQLARVPARVTVDAVGEAVLAEREADAYLERNLALLGRLRARSVPARLAHNPALNLSVKLSALSPRFDPLDADGTRTRVFRRIEPLINAAAACGATLTVDMEQYELKPLILRLFLDLLDAFPDPLWQPAIALQAYLPDTGGDLEQVLTAAQRHGRRLGVRLVKGAYRDQEEAWAAQRGWPLPTWREKAHTDWHYEQLTGRLLANCDSLYPAIAGHNLRSQAVALAHARRLGLPAERWEAQLLLGMAEPLRDALAAAGVALRIYVPVGDPEIGIAYLIRRLLENTASTSTLRHTYVEGTDFSTLLEAPMEPRLTPTLPIRPQPIGGAGFSNLPHLDFSRDDERAALDAALAVVRASLPRRQALDLPGCRLPPVGLHTARNPAQPADVLGEIALAGSEHADAAVAQAAAAWPRWAGTPVSVRASILRRAAELIVGERHLLAALEVLEVGKNWREADADVGEAVDFLRYYAAQMETLAGWRPTMRFPGEEHHSAYAPRGVAVVIAPWNFPLAILAGMTSAALVAGNTVLMKPALPALLVAHEFLRLLRAAGLPADVCRIVPGGPEVGARLVAHRAVHIVAFTGSRAVGLEILRSAHTPAVGQTHVKQVVCEMGGKNAIIVDSDADLDEAVAGIVASAFGYQGQKCSACSRVIAVDEVHDALLERLTGAAAALAWGRPEDPAFSHGPLITQAAQRKALDYIAIGKSEGRLVWQGRLPVDGRGGWYVPPTIIAGIRPEHRLAREEVFGPVLAVMHAPHFETALDWANDSDYALTGGVYSRLPAHLDRAKYAFRVGNLYLNRKITGALVGVQPFGGIALSGTGVQAGGPDYLKQFLWSRCVSENTMRHGFIPAG
jgi:RHH-type transcriptional regulator, proline utilization regulon repressor / proline dehydrogenase / delta 1-pyrroline-5-carboxylate dehydrogenase